ncbi:MAG: S41 family peptidase [Chloroflexota bacterium]
MNEQPIDRPLSSAPRRRGLWRQLALLIAILAMAMFAFVSGGATVWFLGPQLRSVMASASAAPRDESQQLTRTQRAEILWEIWDILAREYLRPDDIDAQKMIHGAASGMVRSLDDPYTAFVEPVSAAILDQDMTGSFEGIGASVEMVEGKLAIVRPMPGSPAEKAGIRAGDVILEVNGVSLKGKTLLEGVTMIRGPEGTVARLLVRRAGVAEPFLVPVTRAKVELITIEARRLEGDIAYVRLREFNAVAARKLRDALKEQLAGKPKGLVFDLRGNPGGYLQSAVEVASELLPRGTLILTEEQRGRAPREFRAGSGGLATDIPLVILVDGGSASASEIVAGAIRDNARGKLIGQRTFGKGSVQNTHTLEDGSSLRVTIARWLLPDGAHLDGEGIAPDIEVTGTPEDAAAGRDPQLERARAFLVEGQ